MDPLENGLGEAVRQHVCVIETSMVHPGSDIHLVTETCVETGAQSIENVADVVTRQIPLYSVVLRWKVVSDRGMELASSQSCCIYIWHFQTSKGAQKTTCHHEALSCGGLRARPTSKCPQTGS